MFCPTPYPEEQIGLLFIVPVVFVMLYFLLRVKLTTLQASLATVALGFILIQQPVWQYYQQVFC